jgi:hypothetical protein
MNLVDRVKKAVEVFINDGKTVEERVQDMAQEEFDSIMEEYRDKIHDQMKQSLDLAFRNFEVEAVALDSEKIRKSVTEWIEVIIDEDDDGDIKDLLREKLYDEIKATTLLPLLQKQDS